MEAWIASCADEQISQSWQMLLEHTREAKELNRINGMLINKQMGHTQGALQALQPLSSGANNFYSASGMSSTIPRSRGFLAG